MNVREFFHLLDTLDLIEVSNHRTGVIEPYGQLLLFLSQGKLQLRKGAVFCFCLFAAVFCFCLFAAVLAAVSLSAVTAAAARQKTQNKHKGEDHC